MGSGFISKSNIPNNIQESLRRKISPSGIGDKFATFAWRGQNSWSEYHCLILNNGSDLKWYNSGSIKNTYSNSMYEINKTLLGVSVDVKSITLKLGLFAVTAEEYRKFLYWMDPMAIDRLEFSTDDRYYYYAKLSNIGESTKWVIGKDNNNEFYYVELTVSFELQGDNYAYGKEPHEWEYSTNGTGKWIYTKNTSQLRNSFIIEIGNIDQLQDATISAEIHRQNDGNVDSKTLFNLNFRTGILNFGAVYNSKEGLISSSNGQLLSLLTTIDQISTDAGLSQDKLLSGYEANKFFLPSEFEDGVTKLIDDDNNPTIYITIKYNTTQSLGDFDKDNPTNPYAKIYCYDKVSII